MKKYLILSISLIAFKFFKAQNCNAIAKNIVQKIKQTNYIDLVPYYSSKLKKWGLMSKNGAILTNPISDYAQTFEVNFNNTYCIYDYCGCNLYINYKDKTFEANKVKKSEDETAYMASPYYDMPDQSINGFEVEQLGTIILATGMVENNAVIKKFSSKFEKVQTPFWHNNKWYAFASLRNEPKTGIIDEQGKALEGFDFNYRTLKQLDYFKGKDSNQVWFYFEDENKVMGFMNLFGETMLKGELLSSCTFYKNIYSPQINKEQSAVLDLRTLKWVIKPQSYLKFEAAIELGKYGHDYSTYCVIVADGNEKYLMDLKGNKYKLKNSNKSTTSIKKATPNRN